MMDEELERAKAGRFPLFRCDCSLKALEVNIRSKVHIIFLFLLKIILFKLTNNRLYLFFTKCEFSHSHLISLKLS